MRTLSRSLIDATVDGGLMAAVLGAALAFSGCERKETILEVDTPRTDVDVTRDKDTGQVEVKVDR